MKTIQILIVMFFSIISAPTVQAQRVWCEFNTESFVVTPDPSLGEELRHTTEAALLWIKMDPASDHNKSGEDGGCFLKPYKQKLIAVNGVPIKMPYCANKIVEHKWIKAESSDPVVTTTPNGGKITTSTVTPNIVVNNNIVTGNTPGNNGNGSSSPDDILAFTSKVNNEGLRLAKGYSEIQIDMLESESKIRTNEKLVDATLNKGNNCCGGGGNSGSSAGVYTTAPQPVIQQVQQPQRRGGGNGAAIAGAVLGGAGLIYDVVADFAGVNGRFRRQSRGVTTVNNHTWTTNPGTNPDTDPFGQPGADPW